MTHRVHLNDTPQVVPASGWQYDASGTTISLLPAGTSFVPNDIYEFSYTAKNPTVNGVGFAAVRDWNAWLRYAAKDDAGTANPLAGDITRIYTEVSSQPGRLLNDFRYLGFNQAENGKQVFDGMMQWIAAGDGISMNYRWSQPGRTERNRQDHLFVEGRFPFANVTTTDPITGKTDSRYAKCIGQQDVSVCHGDLFRQRVLGQGRVVDDDRSDGHEGSAGLALHADLFHVQHAARDRERRVEG